MDTEQKLQEMIRNAIQLQIKGNPLSQVGTTRFGGNPDVPAGFEWPVFETATYDDDEVKPRPLSFLAQFSCEKLAPFDKESLLPKTGLLSFFYEMGSQRWGFDPKDAGCARVYWFDKQPLSPMKFPAELDHDCRLPASKISVEALPSMPSCEDYCLKWGDELSAADYDIFDEHEAEVSDESSKLLGWPDLIQNNMTIQCDLVTQGYYLGDTLESVPPQVLKNAELNSLEEWRLLFQLGAVELEDFELMFGDCGRIYFYIRKADLQNYRFDHTWLILQCS